MGKKTVTDYKTVEVELEKFECDHCESLVDEEDIITNGYVRGHEESKIYLKSDDSEMQQFCEDCIGLRRAHEIREKKEYFRNWWTGTRKKIAAVLLIVPAFILGIVTMNFATKFHETASEPIWVVDLFLGTVFAAVFAGIGGVLTLLILLSLGSFD